MSKKIRKILFSIISIIIISAVIFSLVFIFILSEYKINTTNQKQITFQYENNNISGTLLLPDTLEEKYPLIIFIHGDGPTNRFSNGDYNILINNYLDNEIAVFSWDKQGIGNSTGNWQNQTMQQRAQQALEGFKKIQNNENIKSDSVGFIGFSQGGWVLPKISNLTNNIKYLVIVSGAVNWIEQSNYMTQNRLKKEGYTKQEIDKINIYFKENPSPVINLNKSHNTHLKEFEKYNKNKNPPYNISVYPIRDKDRYNFVALNVLSDSTEDLKKINTKTLAIFGNRDLNVNSTNTFRVYNNILINNKSKSILGHKVIMIENATHAILNSNKYNILLKSWPLTTQIKYLIEGKMAYQKTYLESLVNWAKQNS